MFAVSLNAAMDLYRVISAAVCVGRVSRGSIGYGSAGAAIRDKFVCATMPERDRYEKRERERNR